MFRVLLSILALLVVPALVVAVTPMRAGAADVEIDRVAPHSAVVVKPRSGIRIAPVSIERPQVVYGCRRIWRCDAEVCEWRRGCHGIYGYVEGPYYSLQLARRQWERDALPAPRGKREY